MFINIVAFINTYFFSSLSNISMYAVLEREETERQLKQERRVCCSGRNFVEGDPNKRARAHSH
jgi:hypothetical protein